MPKAKMEENAVLLIIKENQPISIYKLAKKLKISYSAVWNMVERLELKNKIVTELKPKVFVRMIKIKEQENANRSL